MARTNEINNWQLNTYISKIRLLRLIYCRMSTEYVEAFFDIHLRQASVF